MPAHKERNLNVELLRLFACLLVVAHHLIVGTGLDKQVLLAVAVNDVPIFFSITGCFWFTGDKTWGRTVLDHLKRVILPCLITLCLLHAFQDYFSGSTLLPTAVCLPDFGGILQGLLQLDFEKWQPFSDHLWYICSFTELLIWWPIVRLVIQKGEKKLIPTLLWVTFAALVLQDIATLLPTGWRPWWPKAYTSFSLYIFFMLIGYEMYQRREQLRGAKTAWLGAGLFLVLTALRVLLSVLAWRLGVTSYFSGTVTSLQMPILISLWMIFLAIPVGNRAGRVIRFFSSSSYLIFLVHMAVMHKLDAMGLLDRLHTALNGLGTLGGGIYLLAATLLVFLLSWLITLPFKARGGWIRGLRTKSAA